MKYTQDDVDRLVESGEGDAEELLMRELPGIRRRFQRLDKAIAKLLADVREVFPNAEYYTSGGDGFTLLLGPSHDDNCRPQYQRIALEGQHAKISGGDW